jgi:hypothetical protein
MMKGRTKVGQSQRSNRRGNRSARATSWLVAFLRDRRGNVGPLMALLIVPIVGGLGMGMEATNWYLNQRSMQNAADSAVLAAARNGCMPGAACSTAMLKPTYISEARSVTARMGFTNGVNETTVTPLYPDTTAPCSVSSPCYSVTISKKFPVYLLRIVGFNGNTTATSGSRAQSIDGLAMAKLQPGSGFCITALGAGSGAITFNGASSLDLRGCNMASNGGAVCNGGNATMVESAYVMDTGNASGDCGVQGEHQVSTAFTDAAFDALKSNIPPDTCGSYSQSPRNGGSKNTVDAAHTLTTAAQIGVAQCGDVKLGADITLSTDTTLTIYNGRLDLGDFKLIAPPNVHLTIILTGNPAANSGQYDHVVFSSGTNAVLDYAAPNGATDTWKGVALYQDPRLTANSHHTLNFSGNNPSYQMSGNNPEFNITGMIYAPNADFVITGAIDHATAGDACLAFMVRTFSVAGTSSLFATPTRDCDRAGLGGLPKVNDRAVLVR